MLNKKTRSIREIGGEIWAELSNNQAIQIDWKTRQEIVDFVMHLLVRYDGYEIVNDKDLPVQ